MLPVRWSVGVHVTFATWPICGGGPWTGNVNVNAYEPPAAVSTNNARRRPTAILL
jgi:hypothetical protein